MMKVKIKSGMTRLIPGIILIVSCLNGKTQTPSVIRKTYEESHSSHVITKLNFLRPDLYNTAVNDQLGVIGNNFWGEEKLRYISNSNSIGTATDYWAVNGYKTTLAGKSVIYEFRGTGTFESDDDLQLTMVCNPKAPIWSKNYKKIKNRDYNDYPFPYVEGEIDIDDRFHQYYHSDGHPKPGFLTDLCLYGTWIEEVYQSDERDNWPFTKAHLDVHEVHPVEQFWWVEKTGNGFKYYLNEANDASGRFAESGWMSNEKTHTFAIAFDLPKPGKIVNKAFYEINNICHQNVTAPGQDGKKHFLILGRDTLIEVTEPAEDDLMSVSFAAVGIDPYSTLKRQTDSIIKGFIIFQSKLEKKFVHTMDAGTDTHGNFKFVVDKKVVTNTKPQVFEINPTAIKQTESAKPDPIQEALRPKRVQVTLKEIATLVNKFSSHGSDRGKFKLRGYISTEKEGQQIPLSKSTMQILEDKPKLLFPIFPGNVNDNTRVIYHNRDVTTSPYHNSVTWSLAQQESISIFMDFVASYETDDYNRTLELIETDPGNTAIPYKEFKIKTSDLRKGIPLVREIILHNRERKSWADPKEYKMKITIEFLLLD